jgi:hypothetical protein
MQASWRRERPQVPTPRPALAALLVLCAGLWGAGISVAAEPAAAEPRAVIGRVKTVSGEAWVGPAGALAPAVVGSPVHVGATMRTGPGATLGITLHDDTVMSFGPDTVARIDDFLYEPAVRQGRLAASLLRGTANVVSGLIAKLRPDALTMRTPTATLGIRGTHFLVKVDEPAP